MEEILEPLEDLLAEIVRWLPQLLGALLVLFIGYIVVKAIEGLVRRLLRRAGFDKMVQKGTAGSYVSKVVQRPAAAVASVVFWLLWFGVISIAVEILGIPGLTDFIEAIYAYLPNILAAIVIFLVAGAVSTVVAGLTNRTMGDTPTGKLIQTVVPTIVMLIAVFMILTSLQIAPTIVTITYIALVGAVSVAMAIAFGLGGRQVAAEMLASAYEGGKKAANQAKQDAAVGKERAKSEANRHMDR